jgi:DNA-binding transcriptional MerR regulator
VSAAVAVDREAFPYRMKDLCEQTGLPRQVIHFYIQQGLVPEGHKTGRNMAYYGEEHVRRVRLVRKLQHERFLPLKAIRALLDEQDAAFSPAQRRLLSEVQERLGFARRPAAVPTLALPIVERLGLDRADLDDLAESGVLGVSEDEKGRPIVSSDDAWILEAWGEMRATGFTRDIGFRATDLAMYEAAIGGLMQKEAELVTRRLAHLPADRVAAMVERALPLLHEFLARYHAQKVRDFFAAVGP